MLHRIYRLGLISYWLYQHPGIADVLAQRAAQRIFDKLTKTH
jgi:hypothetical protein